MNTSDQNLKTLLNRWLQNEATEVERDALAAKLLSSDDDRVLLSVIEEEWKQGRELPVPIALQQRLMEIIAREPEVPSKGSRVYFTFKDWFKVAAVFILVAGVGAYWLLKPFRSQRDVVFSSLTPIVADIQPGQNRATLTLGDGRTIGLDTAADGNLTAQDGVAILKQNGHVIYGQTSTSALTSVYNVMTTPRGGQYQLRLSDGTMVWLNAVSSIRFPTRFDHGERVVEVTGEAFFEVAKNTKKPFIVQSAGGQITVLGTAFNLNTYPDEPSAKISLVDGKIKVGLEILKPGQAYINGRVQSTNTAQDMAWKEGAFDFTLSDLRSVTRQLARWYDVDIGKTDHAEPISFRGKIGRDLNLQQVLKVLNAAGAHLVLSGRTLVSRPL